MSSTQDIITRFMLEEEEEDDELFLVLVPILYSCLYHDKRPVHTSSLSGAKKVKEILEGHESWCKVEFQMEPEIFRVVASYLRREGLLQGTPLVSIEEQLGMFMYMISHNATYSVLMKQFQHSSETVHRKMKEVFEIIPNMVKRFVRIPTLIQPHPKIVSNPRYWPYFQNCIGAIDGSHVPITISEEKAPPFRNRKGTLSHNIMVACDFDLNFTFISCGWEGSASDAGVLRSAIGKGFHVPNGKYYLIDGGYANTKSFLAPYHGVRYHLGEFRRRRNSHSGYANHKELFNHRHAILRNHIERAIGVYKKRFPILKVGTHHRIENQIKIAGACAAFHNIIRGLNGDEEWLDHQPPYIHPRDFVDLPDGDDGVNLHEHDVDGNDRNALRDQIALQMWADYNN